MSQYSDEELLSLTRQEAQEHLNEKQLKRFNSLKADKLQDNIDEHKDEKKQTAEEGLDKLLGDVKEELTTEVEVAGNTLKVLADPDEHDFEKIQRIRKLANKDEEDMDRETAEELKQSIFDLLGDITLDYSTEDWISKFEENDVGLRGVLEVAFQILEQVEEEMEQKKRR